MPAAHPGALRRTLLGAAVALALAGATPADAAGRAEAGRRIYEDGILPDGTLLTASGIDGSLPVSGAAAACVNCHRRSGYGSLEGRILIPPIAGAALFAPGSFAPSADPRAPAAQRWRPAQIERFRTRPAYDERSLGQVLRTGIDSGGIPLKAPMPRYRLDTQAVAALAAYLRQLSATPDPGMTDGVVHLGVPFAPDIPDERRAAVLGVLRACTDSRDAAGTRWQVHAWPLAGPSPQWPAELDAHYRRQPVFALLSGAGTAEWQPVQDFCEKNALPCVLPAVEAPPLHEGRYSFYFSPGVELEARLLAHQLRHDGAIRRLIQVVADEAGRQAAAAARTALAGSGIAEQEVPSAGFAAIAPLLSSEDAVVLWLRPGQFASLASDAPPSARMFVSATLAAPEELAVAPAWKSRLTVLSVFDPRAARRAQFGLAPWLAERGLAETDLRLRADARAACIFFDRALSVVRGETAKGIVGPMTRERVIEALENVMTTFRDDAAPYYWHMSLGPGQRTAVKGAALLRYAAPDGNELVPAGPRIVP